jgi:carboxylesterase type B
LTPQIVPPTTSPISGATHGVELAYIFNPAFAGALNTTYYKSAVLAQRSWISFAASLNPNHNGVPGAVRWPSYGEGIVGKNGVVQGRAKGVNLVWDAEEGNSIETDTWREAGIGYINSISRQFLV